MFLLFMVGLYSPVLCDTPNDSLRYILDIAGYGSVTVYGSDVSSVAALEIGCMVKPILRVSFGADVRNEFEKAFVTARGQVCGQYFHRFNSALAIPVGLTLGMERLRIGSYSDYIGFSGIKTALFLYTSPQVSFRMALESICIFDRKNVWSQTLFFGFGYSFLNHF